MKQPIYMLIGCPGAGKTWCTEQLKEKFHHVWHDGFIYLKAPKGTYVSEILKQAEGAKKPLLIEAPFSISETLEPLRNAGHNVVPVVIVEKPEIIAMRYLQREKKEIPKGHLTRQKTYEQRAKALKWFHGTTEEVLNHLKAM